jgi:hypothetical protein
MGVEEGGGEERKGKANRRMSPYRDQVLAFKMDLKTNYMG